MKTWDIAIVGGGGAGLTAAMYGARGRRHVVVFERKLTGGQIATTDLVENFPGFPRGVNGFDLGQSMLAQAEKFGATVIYEGVDSLEREPSGMFRLRVGEEEHRARTVIVTAGAEYRHLDVPGEEALTGRGVSYCATCDAAFFKDMDVAVVGGGDAAMDEGMFLTRYAKSVTVIHRRDSLRASKMLQERAFSNPKMHFVWDTVVEAIEGESAVTGARLRNVKTGVESRIAVAAVFVFIGHMPNNELLNGLVEVDDDGQVLVDLRMRTTTPGLFVAGDVRTQAARQLISACGDGATAAIAAERYLQDLDGGAGELPAVVPSINAAV
ncbi:MAG: thioredoxin-disulfide reductase [Dehalococcoidia bacterium]|nr:thioredoxin-disulfide reductase [Dehalococcoidia bacterium]